MKTIVFMLTAVLSMLVASGAASTFPVPGKDADALAAQSLTLRIQSCRAGTYFCPGKISGCCPNGWGCASTHCVRPGPRVQSPSAATTQPKVKSPSVSTSQPKVKGPTVNATQPSTITSSSATVSSPNTGKPNVKALKPNVKAPSNSEGVCPSLKGIAADMKGLLGC
jgi:hypothetical protein